MENTSYTILTRQSGLKREMSAIANNIANASTNGFRQEGLVFSEFVQKVGATDSVSMSTANVSNASAVQGTLTQTGAQFDLAIEGDGFFLVETPAGQRLTRAGSFTPNAEGDLVNFDGHLVLDAGGAPIFVPPDVPNIQISNDGTISALGRPLAQIGVFSPVQPNDLTREAGTLFRSKGGHEPVESPKVIQGFLEDSNVNTMSQLTRMIQVQRAYETGQSFMEAENERVLNTIKTLIK
ncbi:flagellar hook-basal body complex protein [Shimia thalassica]|uniref:flagellar hook-basal body complex protein n=1 Tax=Shimia thalassica TaxID=1715693 RepID=UPI000C071573|nr:flagellar hook-basal body complex protein [Shimia thalassica]MDO6485468.1 flagellar hook-basal body complex protein [Shimia thalassica]MDO6799064.1 flagellar hook-basal body complex protein [Shimia thalassica]PHO05366.1 flagellar basal-body rod protein FlgF [Rhodobacteraceae bacterium 4F10]